ncbi:hypothetical protein [Nitrosopumilus adriaticus]|nr:hypothetical protein [Nitrosopumilus adriaticus]
MKTRLLLIGLFITTIILPAMAQESNLVGGGSVNLDSELAPSFSQDFVWYKFLIPLIIPIIIIFSLFIGTFFVLKLKKISSRPYLSLELAGLLLFFGIPNLVSSLGFLPILISQPEQIRPYIFEQIFVALWVPIVTLSVAGILLYRSSVLRKLIKK